MSEFTIHISSNDQIIYPHIKQGLLWEPHIVRLFQNLVKPTDIVIDVGAHVGLHTLKLAKLAKHVHSFEPCYLNFQLLQRNVNENGLASNSTLYPIALGETDSRGQIARSTVFNTGDNSIFTSGDGDIEIKSLDSMNFEQVDLIKIDTQGSEISVLKGAEKTIQRCRPLMIIEVESYILKRYNKLSKDLFDIIRSLGYVIFLVKYKYPSEHLCIPNEKFEEFWEKYKDLIHPVTINNDINYGLLSGVCFQIDFN